MYSIATKISVKTLLWAASKNVQCLSLYIACPQIMLPYSILERIKGLKIWNARSRLISGNSVNLLYAFSHLLVLHSMWGMKVRSSSMIILSTRSKNTFLTSWGITFIVENIVRSFHGIYTIHHLENQVWRSRIAKVLED